MINMLVISSAILILASYMVIFSPTQDPYIPGEKLEGITKTLSRKLPEDFPGVKFVDVSVEAGIDFRHFHGKRTTQLPEDMGSGAAWGDYDQDGWLDVYVVNVNGPLTMSSKERESLPANNVLYRNKGDGTFEDVTPNAGVGYSGCGQAAAWGDFDNDGFLDLIVTNYGRNVLYRNVGNGSFIDVSESSGIDKFNGFWGGASWGDYNRDGFLDLYICGYVKYKYDPEDRQRTSSQYNSVIPASLNPSTYKPERNLLYLNNGDGTFSEVAKIAGVDNITGRSLSASWCDFDGDGWPDLYVANDISDNVMYRNRGDGTFEDISYRAMVADYRGAMGLAVGDWDGDEDMDLFVTHWIAQENALFNNRTAEFRHFNDGSVSYLNFTDIADRFGLGQIALDYIGWGTAFLDYNNDRLLDLMVINGSTFQQTDDPTLLIPMRMLLFWNRGPEDGFFEVGTVSGEVFRNQYVGRGLAVGDYDNDGDVDAFVVVNNGPALLLRNDGGNNQNWIKVRLKGILSNRFGVGAKLRTFSGKRVDIREVGSGSSYYSQNAVGEEQFGMGDVNQIDSLEITWPSGVLQRLTNIETNQTVVITEQGSTSKGSGGKDK
jgi:hypothetical protein